MPVILRYHIADINVVTFVPGRHVLEAGWAYWLPLLKLCHQLPSWHEIEQNLHKAEPEGI